MFVISNKEKNNWNSFQFFSQKAVYYSNPGALFREKFEGSYIWVETVGNSADAKIKNFPGLFRNQEINMMVFCNLGGVCTVDLRLKGEIAIRLPCCYDQFFFSRARRNNHTFCYKKTP